MQTTAMTVKAVIAAMVMAIRYVLVFMPARYMRADPRIPCTQAENF